MYLYVHDALQQYQEGHRFFKRDMGVPSRAEELKVLQKIISMNNIWKTKRVCTDGVQVLETYLVFSCDL